MPSDYVNHHIKSLFAADKIRFMELIESIQYGIVYLVIGFFAGTLLDYSFPSFNEDTSVVSVFLEVLLQSILLIVLVFYVRLLVKTMPSLFDFHLGKHLRYVPYSSSEYGGELMISLAVIGAQFHLIKKLDFLSRKLYTFIYNKERYITYTHISRTIPL
jgi:hypothetical protein